MTVKEMVKYYAIDFKRMGWRKKLCQNTHFEHNYQDNSIVIVYVVSSRNSITIAKFFTDGRCLVDQSNNGIWKLSTKARRQIMGVLRENYTQMNNVDQVCMYQRKREPISLSEGNNHNQYYTNQTFTTFDEFILTQ